MVNRTKTICQIAILAAMLTAVKMALSWAANVELVTTLIIVYSLSLGIKKTFPIVFIFILIECFIYGFSTWVLMYLIHWPAVAIMACLCKKAKHGMIFSILGGVILTALFSVQTTLLETIFFGKSNMDFFVARYISGAPYFITHIVCNAIALPILVPILTNTISNLERKHFIDNKNLLAE